MLENEELSIPERCSQCITAQFLRFRRMGIEGPFRDRDLEWISCQYFAIPGYEDPRDMVFHYYNALAEEESRNIRYGQNTAEANCGLNDFPIPKDCPDYDWVRMDVWELEKTIGFKP